MSKIPHDVAIEEIHELRRRISAQCDNDPARLVAYYIKLQEQYRDRLIEPSTEPKETDHSVA